MESEMTSVMQVLQEIADKHDERMKRDRQYALTVEAMKESTKPVERSRHYDRDGYCDNPARGY